MRCHYTYDKIAGLVHIPGCDSGLYDPDQCTCYRKSIPGIESTELNDLKQDVEDLKRENEKLKGVIESLQKNGKHSI